MRSMDNGTSALISFQKALSVQSNNAANVNTTAFKADTVSFSDMMYERKVGMGVSMDTPRKDYSQGSLKPTESEYDFAIQGEGFFTMQDPDTPDKLYYTRTGQFKSDKSNYLTNPLGMVVMGVKPTVTGDKISSEFTKSVATSVIETKTSVMSINTYTTNYLTTAKNTGVSGENYKSAGSSIDDIEALIYAYNNALKAFSIKPEMGEEATKAQSSIAFPIPTNPTSNYTAEVLVNGVKFQQGFNTSVENTLKLLSDKINEHTGITSSVNTTTGEMRISSMVPGKNLSVSQVKVDDKVIIPNEIAQESGSGQRLIDATYAELEALLKLNDAKIATNKSEITNPSSGVAPQLERIVLDLNELGMSSVLNEKIVSGDPEAIASYPGIKSENGNIYLVDGDTKFLVGKLTPVVVGDITKLRPEGDNVYTRGLESGTPMYIENSTKVVSRYLENSNVDLSKELVNLINFQKAFEANSKSITTSDELLKTALALKDR